MAKNKIEDLRDHLFAALEGLSDEEKPMDLERARTNGLIACNGDLHDALMARAG